MLEVGAGTGILSLELAARVKSVTAMDPSAAMMEKLQEKTVSRLVNSCCILPTMMFQSERNLSNVEPINAALESIDQLHGQTYDIVIMSLTLHHIDELNPVLSLVAQALKPTGRLFVYDFLRQPGSGSFHDGIDLEVRAELMRALDL